MKALRGDSIRRKLIFIIMLACGATAFAVSCLHLLYDAIKVRQEIRTELGALAEIIANNSTAALMFGDEKAAKQTLMTLEEQPHIVAATIITADNRMLAQYRAKGGDAEKSAVIPGPAGRVSPDVIEQLGRESTSVWRFDFNLGVAKKVRLDNEDVGLVVIEAHVFEKALSGMKWFVYLTLVVLAVAFLLAYSISLKLQGLIADPILRLAGSMKDVTTGHAYSIRVARESDDEVGLLYDGFNTMLAGLQERDEQIGTYHSHLKDEIGRSRNAAHEWRVTFDAARDIIMLLDRQSVILKVNRAATGLLGLPFGGIVGQTFYHLFQEAGTASDPQALKRLTTSGRHEELEFFWNKGHLWFLVSVDPVRNDAGELNGAVLIFRDITALKKAEEEQAKLQGQLMQVQKMDTVGRLAGGIAHDFNNILTTILGYCELAMMKLPEQDPTKEKLKLIHSSGQKAAALTRQLLLFSRQESAAMKVLHPGHLVEGMRKMLGRLIGENIRFHVRIAPDLLCLYGDSGQLEQMLMNLAVNARDAMPTGGELSIQAENSTLGEGELSEAPAGAYVCLQVSDTGEGMTPEIQQKIFEPFFTTKPVGKGTGLGLTMVYGIVGKHGGYIDLASEKGKGSVFRLYFPAVECVMESDGPEAAEPELRGSETILLAEDDEKLRQLSCLMLRDCGYTVIAAADGSDALRKFHQNSKAVDLVLLDVIMPGKNGREVYEAIKAARPGIRVLFMSGYTADIVAESGRLIDGVELLYKPMSRRELLSRIRLILDRP